MIPLVANFLAHEPVRRLETSSGEPKKRPISWLRVAHGGTQRSRSGRSVLARSLPMLVRGRQEDGFWRAFAQEPMSLQVPRRLLRNACGRSACLSRPRFFLPMGKPSRLPGLPPGLFLLPACHLCCLLRLPPGPFLLSACLFLSLLGCSLQCSLLAPLSGLGTLPVALLSSVPAARLSPRRSRQPSWP